MLVIRRRSGQDIEVTGPARFKILNANGAVKIGVEADKSVGIIRSELVCQELPLPDDDGEDEEVDADMGGEGGGNR